MASPSGCFLTRCGVMGRPPGDQARPRWPQLLTAGPVGQEAECRELSRMEPRGSTKKGLVGAASVQAWQGPHLRGMNGGGQEGRKEGDRPDPAGLPAPQDQPLSSSPRAW